MNFYDGNMKLAWNISKVEDGSWLDSIGVLTILGELDGVDRLA
jgi:hypothetical protein